MKKILMLAAFAAVCLTSLAEVNFNNNTPQKRVANILNADDVGVDGMSPWGDIPADAGIEAVIEAAVPSVYNSGVAVDRIMAYMSANTNVWLEVTNYYGLVGIPASLQMYERRDGQIKEVFDQRKWTDWEIDNKLVDVYESILNSPTRKWSKYQSVSGEENPLEDTTWISTPRVVIADGFEWKKECVVAGDIYVLHSNGLTTAFGPDAENYFSIEDIEGKTLFKVVKTSDQTLAADASEVSVDNTTLIVNYKIVSNAHPLCSVAITLADGGLHFYEEGDPLCPANVSWYGESGDWYVHITPKYVTTSLFAKATYVKQGSTVVRSEGIFSATGGILCTDGEHRVGIDWNGGNPKFVEIK